MVETVVTEFSLWSPFNVDWQAVLNRLQNALGKIAELTVPAIGWNPVSAFLTIRDTRNAVLSITWNESGTPAFVAAIIPLLPQIFAILKVLIAGILLIVGLKIFTKEGVVEEKTSVINSIITDDSLSAETKQAALAAVAGAGKEPTGLGDIEGLIKTALFAGVAIVGLLLILEVARGMRRG